MSDAYYHCGLTIEVDASELRVTIDGRDDEIPRERLSNQFALSDSPSAKAEKLRQYAKQFINQSPKFQRRKAVVQKHLTKLKNGVTEWNKWRRQKPEIRPLLFEADLTRDALCSEKFDGTLDKVDFANAVLIEADLREQSLKGANFHEANLGKAKLHAANLTGANFCRTDLYETEMPRAILHNANLQGTQLAKTNLEGAELIGCKIYGLAAWDLNLTGAQQRDLRIFYRHKGPGEAMEKTQEAQIDVDDLRMAQFIYYLLNNENVGNALTQIGEKGILILGRFTDGRKDTLDKIREKLRYYQHDFVPIVFDFSKPDRLTLIETIKVIAGLSRFIIADIAAPRSVPQELEAVVKNYKIPVVPILHNDEEPFATYEDFKEIDWVLPLLRYNTVDELFKAFDRAVVEAALQKSDELLVKKAEAIRERRASDYS